jgi:hypothetical protein
MITKDQILELRLHAAAKFILSRISITATRGGTLSLSGKEVSELLSILNPREPFTHMELI